MGLSLWLVPSRKDAHKLSRIMNQKSPSSTSPSSFPHFEPHITLATLPSTTRVADLRAKVPLGQSAAQIVFKAVEVGDEYFMSVYVSVHHSGELHELREVLKRDIGEETVPPLAHLSLFYIDDSEPQERTNIFEELKRKGRIVERGEGRVALDCSEDDPTTEGVSGSRELVSEFLGSEIWIVLCDGHVEDWEVKQRVQLRIS